MGTCGCREPVVRCFCCPAVCPQDTRRELFCLVYRHALTGLYAGPHGQRTAGGCDPARPSRRTSALARPVWRIGSPSPRLPACCITISVPERQGVALLSLAAIYAWSGGSWECLLLCLSYATWPLLRHRIPHRLSTHSACCFWPLLGFLLLDHVLAQWQGFSASGHDLDLFPRPPDTRFPAYRAWNSLAGHAGLAES